MEVAYGVELVLENHCHSIEVWLVGLPSVDHWLGCKGGLDRDQCNPIDRCSTLELKLKAALRQSRSVKGELAELGRTYIGSESHKIQSEPLYQKILFSV